MDELTVVKMLNRHRPLTYIAAANPHLTRDEIAQIATQAHWPEPEAMRARLAELNARIEHVDLPDAWDLSQGRPLDEQQPTARRRPTMPLPTVNTSPPAAPHPAMQKPTLDQLLAAAARSTHKRTRSLGEKVAMLADDLRARLADERAAAEEEQRRSEQQEAARRRVAAAEAQLEKARRELAQIDDGRGGPGRRSGVAYVKRIERLGVDTGTIRRWAAYAGIDCPHSGKLPADVLDAYEAAVHDGAGS